MAVFPESMNRLDTQDTTGSLKTIENYIRYIQERVEFSVRGVNRSISESGTSSAELRMALETLGNDLSALTSTVNQLAGQVTALGGNYAGLAEGVQALQSSLENQGQQVSALVKQAAALEGATQGGE